MARTSSLLYRTALSVGVLLALAAPTRYPQMVWAQPSPSSQGLSSNWDAYEPPPNIGKPGGREGGGTRGPCIQDSENYTQPIALVPPNQFGTTVTASPQFFVYVPPILEGKQPQMEFALQDDKQEVIYKKTLPITSNPGIVSFNLSDGDAPALETGKIYQWSFSLICNPDEPDDKSGNKFVFGSIRRVEPQLDLKRELEQATNGGNKAAVYAKYGIWYDALSSLAEMRHDRDDAKLTQDWSVLLESVGLKKIAKAPLVDRLDTSQSQIPVSSDR